MDVLDILLTNAKSATTDLLDISEETINRVLSDIAGAIEENTETILEANRLDL